MRDFVLAFADFNKKNFESSADMTEMLGELQKKFPREYKDIREFSSDPTAIRELVEKLEPSKKGVFLNILLQAGNFGKKLSNVFETNAKEKFKLARELRKFAKEITKMIKSEMRGKK